MGGNPTGPRQKPENYRDNDHQYPKYDCPKIFALPLVHAQRLAEFHSSVKRKTLKMDRLGPCKGFGLRETSNCLGQRGKTSDFHAENRLGRFVFSYFEMND